MNTFNENLNFTLRNLLSGLELEQKKLLAQKDASEFTHDCVKKAIVTALEKSSTVNALLLSQQKAVEKIHDCQVISSDVLSSANAVNACTKTTVTNSAATASIIQVATNAIMRLASDVGSIHNLIQASGLDTELSKEVNTIYQLMNDTAHNAEVTCKLAMEASVLSSEISAGIMASMAKNTNTQAVNLLNSLTDQYNPTKEEHEAIIAELKKATDDEKKAKQELKKITVEYAAAQEAYYFAIKELNLNLQVHVSEKVANSYTVSFEHYADPFSGTPSKKDHGPAESYYIFLVKNYKKEQFSILNAMECIAKPNQSIQLKKNANSFKKDLLISDLLDSDGSPMKIEKSYVVFVMAHLKDDYKKELHDFDDVLSAPSTAFTLNTLPNRSATANPVSEKQKALSAMEEDVFTAQLKVDQLHEVVSTLIHKSSALHEHGNIAGTNKDLADQLIRNALELKKDLLNILNGAKDTKVKSDETAKHVSPLVKQLIYTTEAIHKLSYLLIRKKVVNPLISDELISIATRASKDGDDAVGHILIALRSAFTTLTSNTETEAIAALASAQAGKLYDALTLDKDHKKLSLLSQVSTLNSFHSQSEQEATVAQIDVKDISKGLHSCTNELHAAQLRLRSLQSRLATAKVAAQW